MRNKSNPLISDFLIDIIKLTMTISKSEIIASKSISGTELFKISQEISRKFSQVVSVKSSDHTLRIALTPQELKGISDEISLKYKPTLKSITSNVVVMPIDPESLYVSWNLGQTETTSTSVDKPNNIVLRVYPKLEGFLSTSPEEAWFDIDLDQTKTRQKVPLPAGQIANSYTAAIGLRDENNQLTTLATSNAIHSPRINRSTHTSSEKNTQSSNMSKASSEQGELQYINKNALGQSTK